MHRMGIDKDMPLTEAVEYYPQIFPVLRQIGMCCINEENENLSVAELCQAHGENPDSFVEVLNEMI